MAGAGGAGLHLQVLSEAGGSEGTEETKEKEQRAEIWKTVAIISAKLLVMHAPGRCRQERQEQKQYLENKTRRLELSSGWKALFFTYNKRKEDKEKEKCILAQRWMWTDGQFSARGGVTGK